MKRSRRKRRSGKRFRRWVRGLFRGLLGALAIGSVAALIVVAFMWAWSIDLFDLQKVIITGNKYLEREELVTWMELPRFPSLADLDLIFLRERLESHPFVKGARISKNFPSTLQIDIVERSPIAYINLSPFFMVDEEGIILPVDNGNFEFDVPTLTGFNPAVELYPVGKKCLSQKVLEAVEYLDIIKRNFTSLYDDISEVKVDAGDEYVLVLAQRPTKIFLGAREVPRQLNLLKRFAQTVSGIRSLHDYKYVDLRYEHQIIVKERT